MNNYFNTIDWGSLLSDNLEFSLVISNFYSTIYKGVIFPLNSQIVITSTRSGIVGN